MGDVVRSERLCLDTLSGTWDVCAPKTNALEPTSRTCTTFSQPCILEKKIECLLLAKNEEKHLGRIWGVAQGVET